MRSEPVHGSPALPNCHRAGPRRLANSHITDVPRTTAESCWPSGCLITGRQGTWLKPRLSSSIAKRQLASWMDWRYPSPTPDHLATSRTEAACLVVWIGVFSIEQDGIDHYG
jgi:hypothetical protein